jgi:hypothetical protein
VNAVVRVPAAGIVVNGRATGAHPEPDAARARPGAAGRR